MISHSFSIADVFHPTVRVTNRRRPVVPSFLRKSLHEVSEVLGCGELKQESLQRYIFDPLQYLKRVGRSEAEGIRARCTLIERDSQRE